MTQATATPQSGRRGRRQVSEGSSNAMVRFDPKQAAIEITGMVERRTDQLMSLLASPAMWERFKTVALHAVTSNPKILQSDPATVIEAIREAATLGLELNGVAGQGYLVPFWNNKKGTYDCKFMPGWRGLLHCVDHSLVLGIDAQVVYAEDEIEVTFGSNPGVLHRPALDGRGEAGYRGVYATAFMKGGPAITEWMSVADVDKSRRVSRAADDGPWVEWWDQMALKTVIRRLLKRIPLTTAGDRMLQIENEAEASYSRPPVQSAPALPSGRAKVYGQLGIGESDPAPAASASKPAPAQREEPPLPQPDQPSSASDGGAAVSAAAGVEAAAGHDPGSPPGAEAGGGSPETSEGPSHKAFLDWLRDHFVGISDARELAKATFGTDKLQDLTDAQRGDLQMALADSKKED